jgi:curved DNA-binding protein
MEYKDYYKILGVDRNASQKEIKQAYRKLARQYHPDINPGKKSAETRFKEINEANEVLSDPDKRKKYDQLGNQWQTWQRTGGRSQDFDWSQWYTPGGGPQVRYGTVEDLEEMLGGVGGFSDFFQSIFGGMGQAHRTRASRPHRGRDVVTDIEVTLEEVAQGTVRILEKNGRRLEVKIPPGVDTGSKIRVKGEGAPGSADGQTGDLFLRVQVIPHSTFERRGDDLYRDLMIDLYDAILGTEVRVPTLTGAVLLKIPPGTQNGRVYRLAGQGMPIMKNPNQRGCLYVKIQVLLPEHLTDRERDLFRELAKLRQKKA